MVFTLEQPNNLQWMLASIPSIKALQLALSFVFWYVFIKALILSHITIILISALFVSERRTTAALGCALYLTLVGYKVSVPYFTMDRDSKCLHCLEDKFQRLLVLKLFDNQIEVTVLLLLNYLISFYVIFRRTQRNLFVLREQLSVIEDEAIQTMHDAVYTKYTMFKKFQGAMQIVAAAEIAVRDLFMFFMPLLMCIIRLKETSQEVSPRFSIMPTLKSKEDKPAPPIYSVEMDAADFKDLASYEWHIGVPTFQSSDENSPDRLLIIVQHPRSSSRDTSQIPCSNTTAAAAIGSCMHSYGKVPMLPK
ncbi:hypothetical protein ACLOJK_040170 [Asimina triloba]